MYKSQSHFANPQPFSHNKDHVLSCESKLHPPPAKRTTNCESPLFSRPRAQLKSKISSFPVPLTTEIFYVWGVDMGNCLVHAYYPRTLSIVIKYTLYKFRSHIEYYIETNFLSSYSYHMYPSSFAFLGNLAKGFPSIIYISYGALSNRKRYCTRKKKFFFNTLHEPSCK